MSTNDPGLRNGALPAPPQEERFAEAMTDYGAYADESDCTNVLPIVSILQYLIATPKGAEMPAARLVPKRVLCAHRAGESPG